MTAKAVDSWGFLGSEPLIISAKKLYYQRWNYLGFCAVCLGSAGHKYRLNGKLMFALALVSGRLSGVVATLGCVLWWCWSGSWCQHFYIYSRTNIYAALVRTFIKCHTFYQDQDPNSRTCCRSVWVHKEKHRATSGGIVWCFPRQHLYSHSYLLITCNLMHRRIAGSLGDRPAGLGFRVFANGRAMPLLVPPRLLTICICVCDLFAPVWVGHQSI